MKKYTLVIMAAAVCCMAFSGCQKTPEENSVISKAEGLSEDVVRPPFENGQKRTTDIPEHWKMEEKKSNDRIKIWADLELGKQDIGNLPIIEMKNHELSQEELEKLVTYFCKDQELYVPQIATKDVYQAVIERIENKEGAYGDMSLWTVYQNIEGVLKKAVEIAPESYPDPEKEEIKFQKHLDNPALEEARSWTGQEAQSYDTEDYFSADIGPERTAHIEAERYNSELENTSEFFWQDGSNIVENSEIENEKMRSAYSDNAGMDTTGYTQKLQTLMDQYEECMEQIPFTLNDGQKQAEKVLEDLEITGMGIEACDRVLWFPKGAIPERTAPGVGSDIYWQADLAQAQAGYIYTFSRNTNGISSSVSNSFVSDKTGNSYVPPFSVETITMVVTKDGIKQFRWRGIAEEVKTIASNIKLLPFEKIQSQLSDQLFYWASSKSQPANDPTLSDYNVLSAHLQYTYVPAYKEPRNAWLVPAWFFVVRESVGGQPLQDLSIVINAYDGGVIGRTY